MTFQETYSNLIIIIPVMVYLAIATITDIKSMKIPNKLNVGFLIIRLLLIPVIGFSLSSVAGAVIGFLALFIPAMVLMHKMGGDIKCIAVTGLFLGGWTMPIFIGTTCLLGLIYTIVKFIKTKSKKNIPFAPFFLLAHIVLIVVNLTL